MNNVVSQLEITQQEQAQWNVTMLRFLLWMPILASSIACNTSHLLDRKLSAHTSSGERDQQKDSGSCPANSRCPTAWTVNDPIGARIQADMQDTFFAKIMKSKDYYQGYALFSYGGWSNEGQIMILCYKDSSGDIIYVIPNSKKELASQKFTKSSLDKLRTSLAVGKLNDFKPKVFDGIEYEYVHAIRTSATALDVETRVYMKVPSLYKGEPNLYLQVVNAFSNFRQEFYKE